MGPHDTKAVPGEGGETRRRRSNRPGNSQVQGPARPQHSGKRPARAHRRRKPGRFGGETLRFQARRGHARRRSRPRPRSVTYDPDCRDRRRRDRPDDRLRAPRPRVRGDGVRPQPLRRDGDELRQRRPALGLERRDLDPVGHRAEGPEVDAAGRCAAARQPGADAAQDPLDDRVPVEHPELQEEHRRDRAAGDRRPRRALRDGGARGHRLRPRAPRHPALLLAAEGPRPRPHGQRPAGRGRARPPRALARRDPRGRAGAARRLRRRLPDRERQLGRHPQVHRRPRRGLRPARRRPALRHRRLRRGGGRRRGADQLERRRGALRRRGGLGRRPQPGDRGRARRPGEHLSGQGLLDHRRTSTTPRARRRRPGSACSTTSRRSSRAASARIASASPAPPSSPAPTATSAPTASGRWSSGARSTSPASRPSTRRPGRGSGR